MKLDTVSPFEAHNRVEFSLNPQGGSTLVTWAIDGQQPYIGKVVSLFMDCDKMIGQNFETGLASLKALAEKTSGVPGGCSGSRPTQSCDG
ncbi:MAG: hypothetical protein U0236_09800 [Nitrospira sp.]